MVYQSEMITGLSVSGYTVPTDSPESDGTLNWDTTTIVLVELQAGNVSALGYTYADGSITTLINKRLRPMIIDKNPFENGKIVDNLLAAIRNDGHCGLAYMAVSAIDIALWDLKARLLGLPLALLLEKVKEKALIYGSGGFTSYSDKQLEKQLGGWANEGITAVKMKIGRHPEDDPHRIKVARTAIGPNTDLFVDANGAYLAKQAIAIADKFIANKVSWFEEPVSSDNLTDLAFIKQHLPSGINVAAGEYGFAPGYFLNMLMHNAVDVLQADATRCGGITGFLKAGTLCDTFQLPFSFHCAPSVHLHAALALPNFYIGEYFHDHVRIEKMFFDGAVKPKNGYLSPDLSSPGLGLVFKRQDVEKYKIY